ncbi:MAG: 4Fe-4S dicluster domain-containing protein [Methanomassiliicoccales archaeon]|nr:MAG: 4Fe-4S dicluster domain-containing protein [Methanomassiliicoccales archaeon]
MRELDHCIKCNSCMRACPVVRNVGEGVFPGPRSLAVDEARHAATSSSEELLKCSMCLSCRDACPSMIDLPRAILTLRGSNKGEPLPGHARMLANIDAYGYSVRPDAKNIVSYHKGSENGTCLFPGCIATWRLPDMATSAIGLLGWFGNDISVPEGLCCCGSPLEKIGDRERLKKLLERNKAVLEVYESIVTICPGCTGQLNEKYGIESLHIVEYIYEVVGLDKLKGSMDGKGMTVVVHMPCHLARGVGRHAEEYLYQILSSVPNLRMTEDPYGDECCGAGGGLLSGFPEIASTLALRRSEKLARSKADLAVTACPFCVLTLDGAGRMRTLDLTILLNSLIHR